MRRFKQFLKEAYGEKSLEEIIFAKLDNTSFDQALLPMSKKMSQRLFGERNLVKAVHLTDENGIKTLQKLEGTQKSVAAMTDPVGVEVFTDGVATQGGYIVILEGYPVLISNLDLATKLGPQGRRYIPLDKLARGSYDIQTVSNTMAKDLRNICEVIIKDIIRVQNKIWAEVVDGNMLSDEQVEWQNFWRDQLGSDKSHLGWVSMSATGDDPYEVPKKVKGYVIKKWFDYMEKDIWKKWIPALEEVLDPKQVLMRTASWNEIDLVNIKILGVWALAYPDSTPTIPSGINHFGNIDMSPNVISYMAGEPTDKGLKNLERIKKLVSLK